MSDDKRRNNKEKVIKDWNTNERLKEWSIIG